MIKGFEVGLFEIKPFDKEARKQFREEWSKMTDYERLEFMNEMMKNEEDNSVSIEDINSFCEEWWMKSSGEKLIFVDELNRVFENKIYKY